MIFALAAVHACGYYATSRWAARWFPTSCAAHPGLAADALFGLVYYPALVALALDASLRLTADRWHGICWA
jgi:hypothetical protein